MTFNRIKALLVSAVAIGAVAGTAAGAATLTSGAYAASARLTVAGTTATAATVGAQGSAANGVAYDQRTAIAAGTQTLTLVDGITTDLAQSLGIGAGLAEASSTGAAATGALTIAGAGTGLSLVGLGGGSLLGIALGAIDSTATVGIGGAGLTGSGNATVAGLRFTGTLGSLLSFDADALARALPNTRLVSVPGLIVTLNEQLTGGDGVTGLSRETNALRISFSNYGLGTALPGASLTGDIVVGHAQAAIDGYLAPAAVPEPASWALMIVGFGATGAALRRRRAVALA